MTKSVEPPQLSWSCHTPCSSTSRCKIKAVKIKKKEGEGKHEHDQERTGRHKKTQIKSLEMKWYADTLDGQNILHLTNITFS